MADFIRYTVEDRVATLVIDHPPVNALNSQTLMELDAALDELLANDEVKVIVVTGGGQLAFVAGADIGEIGSIVKSRDGRAAVEMIELGQCVFAKIERSPKPVIAAINGVCLGGGLELAMACHMRVAGDRVRLGSPEINLGIIPGMGGTQRLPRLVGKGWAKYLDLSGEFIDADTALRIGLVEKVVPAAELLTAAKDLAGKLASKAPLAVAAVKKAINDGMEVDLDRGLAIEAAQFAIASVTEDRVEGTSAFLEKRKPRWKGK